MSTEEEEKRHNGRMVLISAALNQVNVAAGAEFERQELCLSQSPSQCFVLSFTRLDLLPEIML